MCAALTPVEPVRWRGRRGRGACAILPSRRRDRGGSHGCRHRDEKHASPSAGAALAAAPVGGIGERAPRRPRRRALLPVVPVSAAVALAAGGAAPGSPAIRVLAGGARAAEEGVAEPIIFIHPASGDSADYAPLVARLSWPGPVVGIDAAGLRAGSDGVPAARVQEMAASYL